MPKVRYFLIIFSMLLLEGVRAHTLPIRTISINDGLSNNSVNAIFQDHLGFMWFGTHDGLSCYDGKQFVTFRNHFGDKSSLPYNYIYSVAEDNKGRIWAATGQGVGIYDRFSHKFTTLYSLSTRSKRLFHIDNAVNVVKADAQGNMLIGTNGIGMLRQAANDTVATLIPFVQADGKLSTAYNARAIVTDAKGQVWVGIDGEGVYLYVPRLNRVVPVVKGLKSINALQASSNDLWIGTGKGLYLYRSAQRTVVRSSQLFPSTLDNEDVTSILQVSPGRVWVGTTSNGLFRVDLDSHTTQHYYPSKDGNNFISSEIVPALFQDNERRVWIGTLKGGINIIDNNDQYFHAVTHDPQNKNSLIYPYVSAFSEDQKGVLWVGTDGGGMNSWDPVTREAKAYVHVAGDAGSLSSNLVTSILTDAYGGLWTATYGAGINRFDPRTGKFKKYQCVSPSNEASNYVWLLYEDHEQKLWATTFGGSVFYYDRKDDRFKQFNNDFNNMVAFMEDSHHELWAANAHFLSRMDRNNQDHRFYDVGKPIRALHEDARHRFWIGTEGGGLILFDRDKGQVLKQYTDANGLCNNSVLSILEDKNGKLWMSTFGGLSCFDPRTQKFRNFYRENGLQSDQFSYNAALKLKSGEMLFGGIGGFTRFDPDSINYKPKPPVLVYLTSIKVDNKVVTSGSKYVKGFNRTGIDEVEVPYQKADLSVSFSSVDLSRSGKAKYAYFLENWDKDWSVTTSSDPVSYSHLHEGTYYLHVKRSDASGNWGPDRVLLTVVILPPFYRTIWAYLFYLVGISVSIYLYNRYRVNKARLEHEVELANASAEKEKELNERKTAFFTNVSHEFRTPITLIVNPLKDSLQKRIPLTEKNGLELVYTNAQKLLKLIDQLLAFKSIGQQDTAPVLTVVNFKVLCRELFNNFVKEAEMKRLNYQLTDECEDALINADPAQLEVVINNLYSNAIKYSPEGADVKVTIFCNEQQIGLRVADTGPGIPAGVGDRIFDRYFRGPGPATANKSGFGIGLYLAKTYVEAHHGSLTYRSTEGQGATFEVLLPRTPVPSAQQPLQPIIVTEPVMDRPADDSYDECDQPENWTDNRHSVLVVEDNTHLREYIQSVLKEEYQVYTASNAEKGYEAIVKYSPDLVVTDIMMDGKNGVELCAQIKADPKYSHIPVILLTAITDDQMRLTAAQTGADDYLTKPFEREMLMARVKTLLKNRNTLQQYFYNEVTLKKQDLKVSPEYQEFLKECIRIVNDHIAEEDFNIVTFTSEIGMSRSNLYRKVKLMSGLSISGFVRFIRLRKAAELMIDTNMTISEISFHVGIMDVKYFRKQFNNVFGMNPSDYIKKYRAVFVKKS
ncbi:response regulator [Mucilaginibacter daejeonensis]|uniref:hybrid sensor histidine kinase/response regulator transcription factor n=1 Tax=Mucilaginibacter daejeonensis TaxID=398049 RepID=UPI001D17467F|nr:two-component regulator propeller domain-containing protein [Mucilaginibacter daejeonensis]UEG53352.1 response regulator [Mucilaginibacter daejeonensis]